MPKITFSFEIEENIRKKRCISLKISEYQKKPIFGFAIYIALNVFAVCLKCQAPSGGPFIVVALLKFLVQKNWRENNDSARNNLFFFQVVLFLVF